MNSFDSYRKGMLLFNYNKVMPKTSTIVDISQLCKHSYPVFLTPSFTFKRIQLLNMLQVHHIGIEYNQ